jgi:hypothetical protein
MRSRRAWVLGVLTALVFASVGVGSGVATAAAGSCKGSLKVGITYPDLAQVNQAFDVAGGQQQAGANQVPSNAAAEAYNNVLIDAMNKTKAFGGCTIEPVYYAFNSVAPDKYVDFTQAECVLFTQDEHVSAIIAGAQETSSLADCAKRAKIPLISQGTGQGAVWTKADYKKYQGFLYQPTAMSMDRTAAMIDILFENGSLTKTSKIAVVGSTSPQSQAILEHSYLPALRKHGVKDPLVIKATLSVEQAAPFNLKMKAAGITDVINVPSGAQLVFTLTADAQSQEFFPHYYFTSADAPSIAAFAYPKAMEKASVMSWSSLESFDNAEITQNAATRECAAVYQGHPAPPGGNFAALPERPPYGFCNELFFLAKALDAAPATTAVGFRKGVESLGSFDLAGMRGPVKLGPGRYDGAVTVRMMSYDAAKKAFHATGAPIQIPN